MVINRNQLSLYVYILSVLWIDSFVVNVIKLETINMKNKINLASCISGDYKYIVSGGKEKKLKIWNYDDHKLFKII